MVTVHAVQLMVEWSDWPIGCRAVATMVVSTADMNRPIETMAKTRRRRGCGSPASTTGPVSVDGGTRTGGPVRVSSTRSASDAGLERGHGFG